MWMITKNYIDEPESVFCRIESSDFVEGTKLTEQFRLYDDDGNLYYEGVSSDSTSERAFDPLDDFGTPNAGCTTIRYYRKDKGEWEIL